MTCNKYSYNNLNTNENLADIILNNQNYGSSLNNNFDDIINLNSLDLLNSFNNNGDNWQDIALPHQKSFNYNINNSYDSFINVINLIKDGKNPLPYIFLSPSLIYGLLFVLIIIFFIIILLKNII